MQDEPEGVFRRSRDLILRMDDSQATLEQIRVLLTANLLVRFLGLSRHDVYQWVERTLVRHEYAAWASPTRDSSGSISARWQG